HFCFPARSSRKAFLPGRGSAAFLSIRSFGGITPLSWPYWSWALSRSFCLICWPTFSTPGLIRALGWRDEIAFSDSPGDQFCCCFGLGGHCRAAADALLS